MFAVINFFLAATTLFGYIPAVLFPERGGNAGPSPSAYMILSPLVTAALLIVSGRGFLDMSYRAGYQGGLAFCIFSLANIVVFGALQGFQDFARLVPGMLYPTILLLMLTRTYKSSFQAEAGPGAP